MSRNIRHITVFLLLVAFSIIGAGAGYLVASAWWGAPSRQDMLQKARVSARETDSSTNRLASAFPTVGRKIPDVRIGPYRQCAVQVTGVGADGTVSVEDADYEEVLRTLNEALHELRLLKGGKAPICDRWARLVRQKERSGRGYGRKTKEGSSDGVYPGDVYLAGIPMINQGDAAYCAVASAARVLQNYGIEITMEDMVDLAGSSRTCGTNMRRWESALGRVANAHGMELRTVSEVTDSRHTLQQLLYDYNHTARDLGYEELYAWDYANAFAMNYARFEKDREYPVQREVMLSNDHACDAFEKNVTERIDDSDPLFWSVRLGDVPEKGVADGEHEFHMRLIIGYNEDRGEILYTDSWGKGHELKRMDAEDALSITCGMYYLAD